MALLLPAISVLLRCCHFLFSPSTFHSQHSPCLDYITFLKVYGPQSCVFLELMWWLCFAALVPSLELEMKFLLVCNLSFHLEEKLASLFCVLIS